MCVQCDDCRHLWTGLVTRSAGGICNTWYYCETGGGREVGGAKEIVCIKAVGQGRDEGTLCCLAISLVGHGGDA